MTDAERQLRERTLRRAVLTGDETAWRVWYEETFLTVFRYVAWRIRGNSDRQEEILQETWLIAVKRIREFAPEKGTFADWIKGIATNVMRNELRKRQSSSAIFLGGLAASSDETAESSESTQKILHHERITEILQLLPIRYAEVLKEKYLEQKSVAEIASSWNESTKAVESLLTRARQAFREAFGADQIG